MEERHQPKVMLGMKIFLICFLTPFVAAGILTILMALGILGNVQGGGRIFIWIFAIIWNLITWSFLISVFKGNFGTNITSKSAKMEQYSPTQKQLNQYPVASEGRYHNTKSDYDYTNTTTKNAYFSRNDDKQRGYSFESQSSSENIDNRGQPLSQTISGNPIMKYVLPLVISIGMLIFLYMTMLDPILQSTGSLGRAFHTDPISVIIPGIVGIIVLSNVIKIIRTLQQTNEIQ